MSAFLSIRNDPLFRRYFDAISPFFWPVLYWQLKRAWRSLQKENRTGFLLAITWWGGVYVIHRGDVIAQAKPDPLAPLRPRWDDPVWSCAVPAEFLERAAPGLCREDGTRLPRISDGAPGSHAIDSS